MRKLAMLLGMAAAAVGVWVMFASVGEQPAPVGFSPLVGGQADEPGRVKAAGGTQEPEGVEDEGRSAVETGGTAAKQKGILRVLVTRKDTGEPVPGARVSYYENFNTTELGPAEQEEYQELAADREKLTERFGTAVFADGLGVALVPVQQYVLAAGRHGELYGELGISWNPEIGADREYELELERDLTLKVKVVDSRGEPADGVTVGLLPRYEVEPVQPPSLYSLGSSAAGGGLTVVHFQLRLSRWKREEPHPVGHLLRARIPGWTEGGEPFDGEEPPEDPIVLHLPPTGRILVHTTNAAGAQMPGEIVASVYIGIAGPDVLRPDGVLMLPSNQRWSGVEGEDGVTTFDRVVVGRDYAAMARIGMESLHEVFKGPVAVGQQIDVSLSLEKDIYILSGRVLDEQRQPLGKARLRLRTVMEGGASSNRSVTTAEDGSFKTYANVGARAEAATITQLTVEDMPSGAAAKEPARIYEMVGERTLVPGENELGDMVLSLGPLVVSGHILVNGEAPERRGFSLVVEFLEILPSRNTTRELWRSAQLSVRYPELDRFEVRGVPRPGRHRLRVSGNSILPRDPVEFSPGADDVLVDVATGGSLRASVLLDEVTSVQNLWLRLIPTDGQPVEPDTGVPVMPQYSDRLYGRPSGQRDATIYGWASLWPGGYDLEVLARGDRRPILRVGDIEVAGAEATRDPRLDRIDLRGTLRKIVVQVFDANGAPLDEQSSNNGVVLVNDASPDARLQGFAVLAGAATIETAEPFLSLLVAARGYRPVEVPSVSADTTVRLERYPEIVLKVAGGLPELPAGNVLQASVSVRGRERDRRQFGSDRMGGSLDSWLHAPTTVQGFGPDGRVALPVDGDGTHAVRIMLRNDETRRAVSVNGVAPNEIEVRIGGGQQVFEIVIPEEGLKKALEQAAGR